MTLFQRGDIVLSSGIRSSWKIDCDHLTDADLDTLAFNAARLISFCHVVGVPTGGLRFAEALARYTSSDHDYNPWLIVDDVLTTGASMEKIKKSLGENGKDAIGLVIFARGRCSPWIKALFTLDPLFQNF